MKTLVLLNEWTQLLISNTFNELEEKIKNHIESNWKNFIYVPCDQVKFSGDSFFSKDMKWKKFKLYFKRILFFYEK